MIITESVSSPVLSNIAAAPSRFKIKASAKAFKILSGFYSEPILAIPRELGANAWDSHVKANNTNKMFEVHAPNTLEPWFSIRDFGTGLSPEAIDTIYTTYFESTKTADNDSDGCMGLGSKTPFNYTENFNVTSFYNGKKYVYNCFIDEQGSPNIMKIAELDTNEENGLEIKFGVKISDIVMWVDRISRAYEPFRYRPTIKGAKIEYKPRKYIYQDKHWAMRENNDSNYTRGCNAFMGNYCYPINTSALISLVRNLPADDARRVENALHYGNFDLFFNIGDLEVAPNKEQLQYGDNNQTSNAIIASILNAVHRLKKQIDDTIEKPTTRWHAMYLFNKYNSYNSNYSHIRNVIGSIPVKFNGLPIENGSETVISAHKSVGLIDPSSNIGSTFAVYTIDTPSGKMKRTGTYHPYSDTREVKIFYTNNMSVKNARLRHYIRTTYSAIKFPSCVVVTDSSKNNQDFFKHMNYFGWNSSDVINIDTLPKPPRAHRQKKVVGTDEIFYCNIDGFINVKNSRGGDTSVCWSRKAHTFDSTNTYYYVDFYYNDPKWNDVNVEDHMKEAIKIFVDNKLNNGANVIYGIGAKNKELLKTGKWINLFDTVKKQIEKDRAIYEQRIYEVELREEFRQFSSMYNRFERTPSIIVNINNENTRKMFQTFMRVYNHLFRVIDVNYSFLGLFGIKGVKHHELEIKLKEFKHILDTKYFGLLDLNTDHSYHTGDRTSTIYKIINFIDEKS